MFGGDGVDGFLPPVLLIAGEGCIVGYLGVPFVSEIEMPISFGLLVVLVVGVL